MSQGLSPLALSRPLVYIPYVRMVLLQIRSRLVTAAILYLFLVRPAHATSTSTVMP
jgi:hypothetical protein